MNDVTDLAAENAALASELPVPIDVPTSETSSTNLRRLANTFVRFGIIFAYMYMYIDMYVDVYVRLQLNLFGE
jgi:hypothetical protein